MGYHSVRHAPWEAEWQWGAILMSQAGLWQSSYNWGGMMVMPEKNWFFKRVRGKTRTHFHYSGQDKNWSFKERLPGSNSWLTVHWADNPCPGHYTVSNFRFY